MNYKYPPIYKYGLLLLTIYMFIKHQKILTQDKILLNSVLITLIIFVFDNIIIKNHPTLLENSKEQKHTDFDEETTYDDFENELSDDEINEIRDSYDIDMDSHMSPQQKINVNIKRHSRNQQYDTNMILH